MISHNVIWGYLLLCGGSFGIVAGWSGSGGGGGRSIVSNIQPPDHNNNNSGGFSSLSSHSYNHDECDYDDEEELHYVNYHQNKENRQRNNQRRRIIHHGKANNNKQAIVNVNRSASAMWPPWPLSLLQRNRRQDDEDVSSSDDGSNRRKRYVSATSDAYPSMGALMFSYLRQRTRIWGRQLEEIGSQVWFNLPPTTPPLLIMASIPKRVKVGEDPLTGEVITKLVFPIVSNPFARTVISFGLGMAVLSWSQQELKRKRKLTPIAMSIPYESVSRVFLPPFLPENVSDLEVEGLTQVIAKATTDSTQTASASDSMDSNSQPSSLFAEEEDGNNILSKVSPKIRKHINDIYETATTNPRKNFDYYRKEWKRGRIARKREVARIRRMRIYDELIALQALKRKAAAGKKTPTNDDSSRSTFALVTGASEGIGRAMAVELARWEIPVVLVARNAEKLTALAYDLEACYGVKCCVLQADLSQIDAAERVYDATTRAGISIDILVNNAGVAYEGLAVDMQPLDIERMILLNTVTYAKLSQLYGADMKRRRRGRILMVSSMAGLCNASPNTAVYGATKAFGKSLALSMAREMEPYGVGVTCILPGPVADTQFRDRSGTRRALCWYLPFYPRTSEAVAHQGVVSVLDGDSQTIPGWQNRIFANIVRPIIPQRFEILCVQAAFSPFHFPNLKDLFLQGKEAHNVPMEVDSSTNPSSSSTGNGSPWIPFMEPLYKNKPVPWILKLPVDETEKSQDTNDPPVENEPVNPENIFQPSPPNASGETPVTGSSSTSRESVLIEEEIEIREADTTKDNIPADLTPAVVPDDQSTSSSNIPDLQSEHPATKNVSAPLEIEKEVVLEDSQGKTTKVPKNCDGRLNDYDDDDNELENDNKRNSNAIDGGRRQTKNKPTPMLSSPFDEDQDYDTMFSPRLGPIDILEYRRFTLPKQSDTTMLPVWPPIVIV
jgi:hypothetical protein